MSLYKIFKKPFFGRYMVPWQNPLSALEQKEWQYIQIKSPSGGNIIGLYAIANSKEAKATIVLGHPMGKEAKAYFLKNGYTDLLRQNGYNVLVFDINGFGESSHGNFSYFEDIVAISQKAKEISPNLPVGYLGISLGGQWATIAFADVSHQYDFAIIESAATTLEEFWVKYPMAYKTLMVLNVILPNYRKKIRMVDRIKEAKKLKSILFIYSHKDDLTTIAMAKKFIQNCNVPSELWTVENAQHAMIMKSEHQEVYKNKIIDYFDKSVTNMRR
jgi:alpha-beta hydrolase superfamily lysophospholipase